jgi:biopolymer transport protein ExbD
MLTQRIPMDLPGQARTAPPQERQAIELRIDASGQVFWNGSEVPATALRNMMEAEVERDPNNQPTLQIDTAEDADYGILAQVLANARNAQMQKIGFVKK